MLPFKGSSRIGCAIIMPPATGAVGCSCCWWGMGGKCIWMVQLWGQEGRGGGGCGSRHAAVPRRPALSARWRRPALRWSGGRQSRQ